MRPTTYHKYTKEELDYIRDHCHSNPHYIQKMIGGNLTTISRYMYLFRTGQFERTRGTPHYYYAIYLRKTDELVASGTSKECMEQMGISENTFYALICKSRSGAIKKWDVYIEPYRDALE